MATAEQIKSLIRSHGSEDKERFFTIALQVAAHEARQGHSSLANEIRQLVDKERLSKKQLSNVVDFPLSLQGLVLTEEPNAPKSLLVLDHEREKRIERVLHEYYQRNKLKAHSLSHRRKLLLVGPPGTGKTLTAKVLACELNLPLHIVQIDRLVTKFMGETSAKLRQIFDLMNQERAVYLFDEFDAIGGERTLENDVGEMRRVLNAFLQFLEQDESDSFIVAATNNPQLLDSALFRRFDDVLHYSSPTDDERKKLIENTLGVFKGGRYPWEKAISISRGLSHSDVNQACRDAIKSAILSDKNKVNSTQLLEALSQRQKVH